MNHSVTQSVRPICRYRAALAAKMNFDYGNQLASSRIYIDVALVYNRLGARLTSINISESGVICIKVARIGQQRCTGPDGLA